MPKDWLMARNEKHTYKVRRAIKSVLSGLEEDQKKDKKVFDPLTFTFDIGWFADDEKKVPLPSPITRIYDDYYDDFIYSINLGELRLHIEKVYNKPSAGNAYQEWKKFDPILRDRILGENSFNFLMHYWGFLRTDSWGPDLF